jgi:hypothetical protein
MVYPETTTGFAVKDFQSWNSFTQMDVSYP